MPPVVLLSGALPARCRSPLRPHAACGGPAPLLWAAEDIVVTWGQAGAPVKGRSHAGRRWGEEPTQVRLEEWHIPAVG